MKKLINSVTMFAILVALLSSCGDKDSTTPDPTPGPSGHEVLWSYDMGIGGLADIIPAIDNDDNSYYTIADFEGSKVVAIALDKDGGEKWKVDLDGLSTERAIYANGKVYVATGDPTAIYCLNASTGNVEWNKNLTEEYDFSWLSSVAFANGKLYVSTGQLFEGFLLAYDESGNELWTKQTNLMGGTFNLSVRGNSLFFHDGLTLYRYDDNGASCDSIWAIEYEGNSSRSMLAYFDLPIGEDGNIYIRSDDIFIISPEGQLVKTIALDASFNEGYASNITLTSDNDILIGKGDLIKLSNDGNIVWETKIDDGIIINPAFTTAPTISSNGDFYDAQLFGLYSVKSNGSLNWKINAENGGGVEYGNLHTPVLTHNGNIISVSTEQKMVRCFKGDGKGIANGGWPKPFGDYGNTSSK